MQQLFSCLQVFYTAICQYIWKPYIARVKTIFANAYDLNKCIGLNTFEHEDVKYVETEICSSTRPAYRTSTLLFANAFERETSQYI